MCNHGYHHFVHTAQNSTKGCSIEKMGTSNAWTMGSTQCSFQLQTVETCKQVGWSVADGVSICTSADRPKSQYEVIFLIIISSGHIMLTVLDVCYSSKQTHLKPTFTFIVSLTYYIFTLVLLMFIHFIHASFSFVFTSSGQALQLCRAAGTSCTVQFKYRPCQ